MSRGVSNIVKLDTDEGGESVGIDATSKPEMPVHISTRIEPVDAQGSPLDSSVTVISTTSLEVPPELSTALAVRE